MFQELTTVRSAHALRLAAWTDFHIAVVGYHLYCSSMDGLELNTRLHDANPLTVSSLMTLPCCPCRLRCQLSWTDR
ncbi:MAG: hypothetical protein H8E90_07675 [Anaerolineales bacterium]|nr:hypothetical protein [Anaerolineales bacterium]